MQLLLRENRSRQSPWAPLDPGGPKILDFLFLMGDLGGLEWFHDVPGPPAINFALGNAQMMG